MKGWIERQIAGLQIEPAILFSIQIYIWIHCLIGVLVLGVLLYRSYRIIRFSLLRQVENKKKYMISLSMTYILINIYLVSTLIISYMVIMMNNMQTASFIFPFDILVQWNQAYESSVGFFMTAMIVGLALMLVSITVLLHGLIRILRSPKESFRGIGSITVGLIFSVFPVIFYLV